MGTPTRLRKGARDAIWRPGLPYSDLNFQAEPSAPVGGNSVYTATSWDTGKGLKKRPNPMA